MSGTSSDKAGESARQQARLKVENAALRAVPRAHGRTLFSGFLCSWGVHNNSFSRAKGAFHPPEEERFFLLTEKRLSYYHKSPVVTDWQQVARVDEIKCVWAKSEVSLVLFIQHHEQSMGAAYLKLGGKDNTLRRLYFVFRSLGVEAMDSSGRDSPPPPAVGGASAVKLRLAVLPGNPAFPLGLVKVSWQGPQKPLALFEAVRLDVDATDVLAQGLSVEEDDIEVKFELKGQIVGESKLAADNTVSCTAPGMFVVTCRASVPGEYLVHVLFGGAEHPASPLHLNVVDRATPRTVKSPGGRSNTLSALSKLVGKAATKPNAFLQDWSPRAEPSPVPPTPQKQAQTPAPPIASVKGMKSLESMHNTNLEEIDSPRDLEMEAFRDLVDGLVQQKNLPKPEILIWLFALWERGGEMPSDVETLANMFILEQLNQPI